MKRKILLLFWFLAAVGILAAQDMEERSLRSFTEVRVSNAIDVRLIASNEEKVIIRSDNVDLDEIETDVSGSILKIYLSGNRYRKVSVEVDVYFKTISGISANSASNVKGSGIIKTNQLYVSTSSAASIEVEVEAERLKLDASSSGDLKISGKATEVDVDVSSAGSIYAYDLNAEVVTADASSAGNIKISVSKELEAAANSAGSIRYRGNPGKSHVRSNSGGSVRSSN